LINKFKKFKTAIEYMGRKINDNNMFTNDFLKAVIQDVGDNGEE